MKKLFTVAAFLLLLALPATAQEWSFGAGTGPFVFGDFMERRLRLGTGDGPSGEHTLTLSAATRPGLVVDFENSFAPRWAVRAEASFTRSPLTVRQSGEGEGVELSAGDMNVVTLMLPVVFRINPRGTFRFHLLGGPAAALYHLEARENAEGVKPAFEGAQVEWGVAFGGGVAWWLSDRFAIEGTLTDTITTSPIDEENLSNPSRVDILKPHNAHGTVGVRWRF
jgi:hypothetical protein